MPIAPLAAVSAEGLADGEEAISNLTKASRQSLALVA